MVDETNIRAAERAHESHEKFLAQTNEAAVSTGHAALKTITLINGGAIIAVLGFISALIGQGKLNTSALKAIADTLPWFAGGVALSAISLGASFFANYTTSIATASHQPNYQHPYLHTVPSTPRWDRARTFFVIGSFSSGIAAIVAFIVGTIAVYYAIIDIKL